MMHIFYGIVVKYSYTYTVVSRYYVWLFEMLLITRPDQYPNYYKPLEICTG